jgi:hypothetical protein
MKIIPESRERLIVLAFCFLAAVHVFVFSAALPFFNNVDEINHFDLTVKYAQGHPPRGLQLISSEAMQYLAIYGSQEYSWQTNFFADGKVPPPPWTQSAETVRRYLAANEMARQNIVNYEDSQPPLYYTIAAAWWRLGKICGLEGGGLLYWLRFMNIFVVIALVWLGYLAARLVFPDNLFLRLGVAALPAFIPQTAFYTIENDILSPLCFGAAFIFIFKFLRDEIPATRLGIAAGLALAATFLTKISNLPLLAASGIFIVWKIWHLLKEKKTRAVPSIVALVVCAGLPMALWAAWCKSNFGDFTGSEEKMQVLDWTHKPFAEWWHHPIFTPSGFWIFIHDLLSTFWRGEIMWHQKSLAPPAFDLFYVSLSIGLITVALTALLQRSGPKLQRQALWLGLTSFVASILFSAALSLIYDFHDCTYPSREHPYFTSGRLMLGALIPFLLLFVFGLDRALKKFSNAAKFAALAALILFMLISEIVTDWPVFTSQYNWYHM